MWTHSPCPVTPHSCKQPCPIPAVSHLEVLERHYRVTPAWTGFTRSKSPDSPAFPRSTGAPSLSPCGRAALAAPCPPLSPRSALGVAAPRRRTWRTHLAYAVGAAGGAAEAAGAGRPGPHHVRAAGRRRRLSFRSRPEPAPPPLPRRRGGSGGRGGGGARRRGARRPRVFAGRRSYHLRAPPCPYTAENPRTAIAAR